MTETGVSPCTSQCKVAVSPFFTVTSLDGAAKYGEATETSKREHNAFYVDFTDIQFIIWLFDLYVQHKGTYSLLLAELLCRYHSQCHCSLDRGKILLCLLSRVATATYHYWGFSCTLFPATPRIHRICFLFCSDNEIYQIYFINEF